MIPIISVRFLWSWKKPVYITMTHRQIDNKWSGGKASHFHPQILRVQKSARKFLVSIFWDQVVILHVDFISKSQTINEEYYSPLLVQLTDSLKLISTRISAKWIFFMQVKVRFTGQLQNRNKLAYLCFQYHDLPLYSPYLTPLEYHLLPWLHITKGNRHFRPTRRSMMPRSPG